ncbi:hypothetical protein T12_4976 [Trichinella patagoniensis]|uniref:Uncharacterized protein n=1 Tax=Trichinella patagoniensis TaxID=990121 RepID=A0A0V0ZY18_9BILA|nr:hypothetical protein T12_4976 [Trichinella patagoniensis]
MLHIYPYLLHTLRIYSNFALFSGSIGLCYQESGNSAFPVMSELVDQSDTSVWNCGTGAALNQPPVLSASFSFTQMFLFFILALVKIWLSHYHYCYGVETHKQEQPCTDLADPQDTYTLGSKSRIHLFGGFEIHE